MKFRSLAAVAAASALAVTLTVAPAQAHQRDHHHAPSGSVSNVKTVATDLAGPLRVAFGPRDSLLVAEAMGGKLTSVSPNGKKKTLVNRPGREIVGVSYARGTTYYFDNDPGSDEEPPTTATPAYLKAIDHYGRTHTIADMAKFEKRYNPDGKTVYGVRNAPASCLAQAPYLQSSGEVYSHPYSSVPTRYGVYVGDAGANAILHVNNHGKISLVKKLPAEPMKITKEVQAAGAKAGFMVPDCMLGRTYWLQPVPTDITIKGHWMYYTVLPGFPGEQFSKGKVYKMNLHTKRSYTVADNLNSPTGVAVDHRGAVYVSELFGGGVAKISRGKAVTVLPAGLASDVAISGHRMAVSTDALPMTEPPVPAGKLVTARVR